MCLFVILVSYFEKFEFCYSLSLLAFALMLYNTLWPPPITLDILSWNRHWFERFFFRL